MNDHDSVIARLLASPAFARARMLAATSVDDPKALRKLLIAVDGHRFGIGRLDDAGGGVHLDILCAIAEAHLEELLEPRPPHVGVTGDARRRLVVAALQYLVREDDAVPDWARHGHLDDVAILRWVTRAVQGHLPVH